MFKPYHFRCVKILPTAYDDSLSYYEQICSLVKKVNEIVEYFNTLGDFVTREELEQKIREVQDELHLQLQTFESRVDTKLLEIDNIKSQIISIESELAQVDGKIASSLREAKAYADSKIVDLTLINPYTAQRQPLQDILNYIANLTRSDALTATEYDAKQLTATAYDAYELTAFDYDNNGKSLLA